MQRLLFKTLLMVFCILTFWTSVSWAQDTDQVLVVPFSQQNPLLPHPAHEDAPITLKAIIRNATCGTYQITWDVNRNGDFNDDYSFNADRNGTTRNVQDIGRTFMVPRVDRDRPLNINVRARPTCGGPDKFGTFYLFVYNFGENGQGAQKLSRDPTQWTTEQLEILATMAIQEALWHTHRNISCLSGRDSRTIRACSNYSDSSGVGMWIFVINNHLPAFPPSSINADIIVNGQREFAEYEATNARRWNNDPYAETSMRILNWLLHHTGSQGIGGGEEDKTCGYRRARTAVNCQRIAGTEDAQGYYAINGHGTGGHKNMYTGGMNTGALSTVLPALYGTKVQTGVGKNLPWNYFVQQLVDYLGYAQLDGGCADGGWYYHPTGSNGCSTMDLSTAQWAYIGLESAEIAGKPYEVIVSNRHKFRIANNLINNQRGDGGGAYRSSEGGSNFMITGGQYLAARWMGINNMPNNNNTPFNESGYSYRSLKNSHDRYHNYIRNKFTEGNMRGSIGWTDGNWSGGDYLCGNRNRIYGTSGFRCGNTYSLYSHQKAYHTGSPQLDFVGDYEWYRMFATYFIRAQYRYADPTNNNGRSNYGSNGEIRDEYCPTSAVTCNYGAGHMSTIMGGLVLTPAVFNPKPVALGSLSTNQVTEGCVPGNGRVTLSHQESFHPNNDAQIVLYSWDMDNSNGLWWDTGAAPDLDANGQPLRTDDRLKSFTYVYQRRGNYNVTLRVQDNGELSKSSTIGSILVDEAEDVPPSMATGGPYIIEIGDALKLNGSASDSNLDCGDKLTVDWNLDYSLELANAQPETYELINGGDKPNINWNQISNLPRNAPITIRARVSDLFQGANEGPVYGETTLWIYDKNPIAQARVNPEEAACRQEVTFDGSNSFHPNPQRTIANYQWQVGDRTSDRPIFKTNFNSYGVRQATLTVTDDLNRSSSVVVDVDVNQGNLPPIVRVARDVITVMSNEPLVLDARQSSDPNADCGDQIIAFEWDLRGDGLDLLGVAGPDDASGALVSIPVGMWQDAMGWNQGNDTLLVRLTVRDNLGGSSTKEINVNAVRAEPIPSIIQIPNPSPYRVDNGQSSTRIDGRESDSLIADVTIDRYEWDLGCDGAYEREGGQFLYEKVFPPNTRIEEIIANPVTVCLRITDSNGVQAVSAPYSIQYQELGDTSPFADADPSEAPEKGYHVLQGEGLTLDGRSSFDPDSQDFDDFIREYAWTLNGTRNGDTTKDANAVDDEAAALLEVSSAELDAMGISDVGEYPIVLDVLDIAGNSGTDNSTVTVHRATASISIVINPENASPNSQVTFDASRSEHTHPDIEVNQVIWFFGDLVVVGGACETDQNCAQGFCINNPDTNQLQCMDGSLGSQEGEIVNQTFDEITPDDGDAIGVTVVIRDNNGGQSQTPSEGAFNEGDDGNSTRFGIRVDQGNRDPVANPGGGTAVDGDEVIGSYTLINDGSETIIFDGSNSSDPDSAFGDDITDYTWNIGTCQCSTDVNLHNNCPVDSAQVGASLPELTLNQLSQCEINGTGSFAILLSVRDRFGETAQSETELNIVNGPTAFAQADPGRTGCQQIVNFDGRGSTSNGPVDQGFNIVSYEWDLDGDGDADFLQPTFVTPVTALPTGNPPQVILNARLTVTNAIGIALIEAGLDPGAHQSVDDIEVVIDVQNQPPNADPGGVYRTGGSPQTGFADVTVDGRGSTDPNAPCDSISEYWWDTDGDDLYGPDDNPDDFTGPVVSFNNANWQPNTTASIGLKVKDQFGAWSIAQTANIIIDNVIPPSGEILSPRAGECADEVGNLRSVVDVRVSHLADVPEAVDVTINIAGQDVGSQRVGPGTPVNYDAQKELTTSIEVDLSNIPEGTHEVIAKFVIANSNNPPTTANAGGRVTFDFTAPVIVLGAQPAENVCYANGRVPPAEFEVTDNFDEAPQVSQSISEDGCGRTLRVVATDYCGRERVAERDYLIAQSVTLAITGAEEGALQEDATVNWSVVGLAACATDISAVLSRDGGIGAPYQGGTPIVAPGDYSLRVSVWNCLGVPREQVVNFRVNRPPVANPRPEGHPNADPNVFNGYVITEGTPLTLDASASVTPEFDDQLTTYTWDVAGQQSVENTPQFQMNTLDNGVFIGNLTVEDSFTEVHSESFQVTITDLQPVPNAGGPYVANQDENIEFDGSQSRSLNPQADPLSRYEWDFDNDGEFERVGALQEYSFDAQGAYNVTLRVHDEDGFEDTVVGVIIADVDPQIDELYIDQLQGEVNVDRPSPIEGYEVMPVRFGVTARPGSANDPITLYQWDFDGDNIFELSTDIPFAEHQFMDPGLHTVGVLVRDRDSFTFRTQLVDVKPIDFAGVFDFIRYSIEKKIADNVLNVLNRARLAGTPTDISYGLWAQSYDEVEVNAADELENGPVLARAQRLHLQSQGVSFIAAKRVLNDLVQTQLRGADFGTEIWSLSRQLSRELDYDITAVKADSEGLYANREIDPVYQNRIEVSENFLSDVNTLYSSPEFEDDARDLNQTQGLALTLQSDARKGLDWLNVAVDQCNDPRFDNFNVYESINNPAAYFNEAETVRAIAYEALDEMLAEMIAYAGRGNIGEDAPARAEMTVAIDSLRDMLVRAEYNMSTDCNIAEETCATNQSALEIELEAMDLIDALNAANTNGAYVMHWQSCLVEYLRFRIKSSLVAVRFQCGQFNPLYLNAQDVFEQGEKLLTERDDIAGALEFYTSNSQRCLILDVYNKCLVRVDPNIDPIDYPDVCLE